MPKHLWLLSLCWLLCWNPLAKASPYGLQVPREWSHDALNLISSPWIFSEEGIWERKSGRYLQALPFELEKYLVDELVWAEPWLLAKDGENDVHQALLDPKTGAKFLRRFPYGPPEARHKSWDLVHNGFWLATLNLMPDGQQLFWFRDLRTGQLAKAFSLPGEAVSAWDLEGEYLAIARRSPLQPMLEIWHWPSGKLLQTLDGLHTEIDSVQLQGPWLAAIDKQRLCVWDWQNQGVIKSCQILKSGESIRTQHAQERGRVDISTCYDCYNHYRSVVLTPDGELQNKVFAVTKPIETTAHFLTPASWYQPETGRFLQIMENKGLRYWSPGQPTAQYLDLCQKLAQPWNKCDIQIFYWQGDQVFLFLGEPNVIIAGAGIAEGINESIDFQSMSHKPYNSLFAAKVELQHQKMDWIRDLSDYYPIENHSCLEKQNWVLLNYENPSHHHLNLLLLNRQDGSLAQWPNTIDHLPGNYLDFLCNAEGHLMVLNYESKTKSFYWIDFQSLQPVSVPLKHATLAIGQHTLLSLSDYGYLLREPLHHPAEPELLMPGSEIKASGCRQIQHTLYCQDKKDHWWSLDLRQKPLAFKALQHLLKSPAPDAPGLNLYTQSFFQHGLRKVLLYVRPTGLIWVTDQGHFFRQGEIPAAEMPYLVADLKSLDLPPQLESWPEVQRALQGLPPLHKSGIKLNFQEE